MLMWPARVDRDRERGLAVVGTAADPADNDPALEREQDVVTVGRVEAGVDARRGDVEAERGRPAPSAPNTVPVELTIAFALAANCVAMSGSTPLLATPANSASGPATSFESPWTPTVSSRLTVCPVVPIAAVGPSSWKTRFVPMLIVLEAVSPSKSWAVAVSVTRLSLTA